MTEPTPDLFGESTLDPDQYRGPGLYLDRWAAYDELTHPPVDFYQVLGDRLVKSGDRVLDIGCGKGHKLLEQHAREPNATYTGVDIEKAIFSASQRKVAAAGITAITFQVCRMQDLVPKLGINSFDKAFAIFSLHHVPVVRFGLMQLCEVIGPDGTAGIATIDPENKPKMRAFHRLAMEKCGINPSHAVVMPSRFDTDEAKLVLPNFFETVEVEVEQNSETRVETQEDMELWLRALASYRTACAGPHKPNPAKWKRVIDYDIRTAIENEIADKERNGEEAVFIDAAKRTGFICQNSTVDDRPRAHRAIRRA